MKSHVRFANRSLDAEASEQSAEEESQVSQPQISPLNSVAIEISGLP